MMHTTALPDHAILLNQLKSITAEEVIPVAAKQQILVLLPQIELLITKKLLSQLKIFIDNIKLAKDLYKHNSDYPSSLLGLGLIKRKPISETSNEHPNYKTLQIVIRQANGLINSFSSDQQVIAEIAQLVSILNQLIIYYQTFIENMQRASSTEDRLATLNTDQTELRCLGLPHAYLTPSARREIMKFDPTTHQLERPKDEIGGHVVRQYGGLHFKFLGNNTSLDDNTALAGLDADDDPGMAYAIKKLFQLIYPRFTMIPATNLIQIQHQNKCYPIQVSLSIPGKTFQDWLEEGHDITSLSKKSFSAWIIFSILIRPRDAKTNNFLVIDDPNAPGEKIIVGIDNDDAFGLEWLLNSRRSQEHIPGVKNFLFCMEQMQLPIDNSISAEICQLEPAVVICQWLLDLLAQNEHYEQLQQGQILTPAMMEKLNLPFKLMTGTVQKLYQDFKKIQTLLRNAENPFPTHQTLLNTAQPLVGAYYKALLEKYPEKTFLEIFYRKIYKFTETIESVLGKHLLCSNARTKYINSFK
jgi:hypothetical protein